MFRLRNNVGTAIFSLLTLGSLGFGVSQAFARPTLAYSFSCRGVNCMEWCQDWLNHPDARGTCNTSTGDCECWVA